ncbi:unnamed protein product [Hermetia illucens]|uniref:MD-2-related lipid-recognition domain-containing protein n=1 Tax=Hermetia illucens TaxID=343691 RepID=A0A7R8YKM3_HERIL|nr:unnamed protein product [Hermetia illucens]
MLFMILFMLGLATLNDASFIRITSFICEPNKMICQQNVCAITTVRKRLSLVNFNCNFLEPQSHIWLRMKVYRKQSKVFQPWLVDFCENFCNVIEKTTHSQVFLKLLPGIRKYGHFSKSCPLEGNTSLSNYPIDFSFIPVIIPEGEYLVTVHVEDYVKNETILFARSGFVVRYPKRMKN